MPDPRHRRGDQPVAVLVPGGIPGLAQVNDVLVLGGKRRHRIGIQIRGDHAHTRARQLQRGGTSDAGTGADHQSSAGLVVLCHENVSPRHMGGYGLRRAGLTAADGAHTAKY